MEANKSEVESLLEKALASVRDGYDVEEALGHLHSAEMLLRDDAGDFEGLAEPGPEYPAQWMVESGAYRPEGVNIP